ncbi:MAG: DUF502 domain-containing protein [Acidobacteriota bacterium]|jgi:uncharacterized membrane protein|uniref:DUF502 domain-containing protein n=1 Tax=marine metagenome TaxID=408172 RepID=A0A381YR79_9ZZZZ|nr:hypothetical protein [Acidobacteriota bacterium]MEC8952633.1 DUF502 domain-containing protein [Acidobacteriota bacterium]MEC9302241.1 DUF502 domain-containing protein [Acidobacteriota bacterium]|tara:strand:- start:835 stop:1461 length:627 start_codon:yes stop_codon:yes gene_type:complete
MQWFRRSLIAGFFVTVPLIVSVVALVWMFQWIDGLMGPHLVRWLGQEVPGLGLLATIAGMLIVGAFATNVLGRRLVERAEKYLMRVPIFKTVYAPVKQLMLAFSPDNEYGFKKVVIVEDLERGFVLGFLTKEFDLDRGLGAERLMAIYVPTNHLYLGDIRIYPSRLARFPNITVQEGIRIFLTGGMAVADLVRADTEQVSDGQASEPL